MNENVNNDKSSPKPGGWTEKDYKSWERRRRKEMKMERAWLEAEIAREFPTAQDICVSMPLYVEYGVKDAQQSLLNQFASGEQKIELFCIECQRLRVFVSPQQEVAELWGSRDERLFTRTFHCISTSRKAKHAAHFHFRYKQDCFYAFSNHDVLGVLVKVGQFPSMREISEAQLHSYRKVLTKEEYLEYARAVGLASQGVGIGSFVYLRRLFERLIDEAKLQATKSGNWDDRAFQQARMQDKLVLVRDYLPPFMVEQRKLYAILSKGVHALTEKECLEAFPVVRAGIELILDQRLAARAQQEKMEEARKRLNQLQPKRG